MNHVFKHTFYLLTLGAALLLTACGDDDVRPGIDEPTTYSFIREGQSTVSFSGQTARIKMAGELIGAMGDFDNATKASLLEMFRNETAVGGDADPFADPDLNADIKSIREKVAASKDYFFTNTTDGTALKNQFESWLAAQVDEVFANRNELAQPGVAGQLADGSSVRFVSAEGLEYNQLVAKGLIGALMADQMLNNYLSVSVLDEGDNRQNNDEEVLESGKNYTSMEHKWDEAYGYVYGSAADPAEPNLTIGQDDAFLNRYIGRVESDPDFAGIADDIFQALKLGRAAIVAGDYELRDEQANIVREKISEVIAVRAVHYLQAGKKALEQSPAPYGNAFHALSEGYGFIFSLQFTRMPNTDSPYFTKAEVDAFLADLLGDGPNGLWDVTPATLDALSQTLAAKFKFSVAEAAD